MISFLVILFLIFLIVIVFYGFGFMMRDPKEKLLTEKCEVCRNDFPKVELIEKQIKDFKIVYFCKDCIKDLNNQITN